MQTALRRSRAPVLIACLGLLLAADAHAAPFQFSVLPGSTIDVTFRVRALNLITLDESVTRELDVTGTLDFDITPAGSVSVTGADLALENESWSFAGGFATASSHELGASLVGGPADLSGCGAGGACAQFVSFTATIDSGTLTTDQPIGPFNYAINPFAVAVGSTGAEIASFVASPGGVVSHLPFRGSQLIGIFDADLGGFRVQIEVTLTIDGSNSITALGPALDFGNDVDNGAFPFQELLDPDVVVAEPQLAPLAAVSTLLLLGLGLRARRRERAAA